jgi:hypothetical protein
MQYQVPQFIEVEDRLFGPLTLKQFIYVAGGAGMCFLIYVIIPWTLLAFVLMAPVGGFALALAFYKVNGKPFINTVEASLKYFFATKFFIWKKVEKPLSSTSLPNMLPQKQQSGAIGVPKLSQSKLKELTWSLDIKESINPVTREDNAQ